MSVVDLRAETRAYGRARLRELALDAARDVVLDRGWAAVRMGAIAKEIGISRQTLHGEFGTKDDLGNALVMR
jgi:AcrR family transcriptional regulator